MARKSVPPSGEQTIKSNICFRKIVCYLYIVLPVCMETNALEKTTKNISWIFFNVFFR